MEKAHGVLLLLIFTLFAGSAVWLKLALSGGDGVSGVGATEITAEVRPVAVALRRAAVHPLRYVEAAMLIVVAFITILLIEF